MKYEKLELLINGTWRSGSENKSEPVYNPATNEIIGDLPHASKNDLKEAMESNKEAFKSWKNEPSLNRQKIIENACRILEDKFDQVATNLTTEMGKPLVEAKMELSVGLDVLRWYGEEGKRAYGRLVPSRMNGLSQTVIKEPIGPCLLYTSPSPRD